MVEIASDNIRRYRSFLENIDVQELNNFEWEHLCVVLSSRVDIELYPFSLKSLKLGKHTFCYIPTGDQIVLTFSEQLEFVRWIEDEYMFGEPYSSYLAFRQEMDKEDVEYEEKVSDDFDAKKNIVSPLRKRREATILRNEIIDELRKYFEKDQINHKEILEVRGDYDFFKSDITIEYNNQKLIAIEVKLRNSVYNDYIENWAQQCHKAGFKYAIFTDGETTFFSVKSTQKASKASTNSNDSFASRIAQIARLEKIPNLQDIRQGLKAFRNTIEKVRPSFSGIVLSAKIRRMLELADAIEAAKDGITITNGRFVFDDDRERQLFDILLRYDETTFARFNKLVKFSTLRSIHTLLEKQTQNMCSLVCMNDPNEVEYAFEYIKRQWKGEDLSKLLNNNDDSNNAFIISGSKDGKENDLTMWRLYGDDTKGVCVKYKLDIEAAFKNGFYFAPVCYGQTAKSHIELDFVRELLSAGFHIQKWTLWRHFFKDYAYKVEDEIRLLYTPKLGDEPDIMWFTDDRTKIYAPMVLFKIGKNENGEKMDPKFPLTIEKIYLGANQPAKTTNEKQFEKRFREVKIFTENTSAVFECSGVTNYRS